ncbi:MAG: DNA methylase, partial [Chloroflexi bacterium]
IWEIDQKGEQDGIHPTQKPCEVFDRPIISHTREGEVVLEPFSGSGTEIISAEKAGRRCFALELSPAFVDVAVRRWQNYTGKTAVLDGDGRMFDVVAEEREPQPQEATA